MGCTEIRVGAHLGLALIPATRLANARGWGEALVEEKVARMPESHHETDSAIGPISGEAPEVAVPISPGLENGVIPRHDDRGDDLRSVLNESRSSEPTLRQIIHKIPTLAWCNLPDGSSEFLNQRWHDYTGLSPQEADGAGWKVAIHPEDLPRVMAKWGTLSDLEPGEYEVRLRRSDGVFRWFLFRIEPLRDEVREVVRWYGTATDIESRKRIESLRATEKRTLEMIADGAGLRDILNELCCSIDVEASPVISTVLLMDPDGERLWHTAGPLVPRDWLPAISPVLVSPNSACCGAAAFLKKRVIVAIGADGNPLYANQALLEYTGLTKEEVGTERFREVFHQEDSDRLRDQREAALSRGLPFEYERRVRRRDGQYRWLLVQYNPPLDEQGKVIRWYATGTDIDERKQAEERTRQENVALREQIYQVFMFDEIVGSCPALKTVLSGIVKVAPTDSTVLITGETGTGKELIARAIHKGSQRASQAFIAVNCAAIPSSLIASELFGHEKGAFTGALQRRQGRFELAHSGTIFLDEIGELPAETQIALLRVLQERQFERVGGSRLISTDVRIIAATNRDLPAAIASGTFRADLFYRLNIFPTHVPPLRNRKEDIPMLVEYFVKRYAEKTRKTITRIDKNTLKLCQSYRWPGNIRELQNIVERSVILCSGDTFWVDEAWLSSPDAPRPKSSGLLTETVQGYEKELIEAALAESNGKVAGPNGAAVRLGIPRSTLDLKIKQLNIKKHIR